MAMITIPMLLAADSMPTPIPTMPPATGPTRTAEAKSVSAATAKAGMSAAITALPTLPA